MADHGILWLAAVNLITWTGLFLYLMALERRVKAQERAAAEAEAADP